MRIFDFKRYVENIQTENVIPYEIGSIIAREPKYRGNTDYYELVEFVGKLIGSDEYEYMVYPIKSNLTEVKGSKMNIKLPIGDSKISRIYVVKKPNGVLVSQKAIDADNRRNTEEKMDWAGKKPLCLMTKEEYKKEITPFFKEYIKFTDKNSDYIRFDYSNLKPYYVNDPSIDKESFIYKYKLLDKVKDAPREVVDKLNYYESKIKELTGYNLVQLSKDDVNSNKKFISIAISDGTYENLLKSGKVNMKNIEEVLTDAKLKVPKKLYDVDISVKDDGITLDKETQLINDKKIFKQSIIDMFIDVYNDAAARYYNNYEPFFIKYEKFNTQNEIIFKTTDELKKQFHIFLTGEEPRIEIIKKKYSEVKIVHYSPIIDKVFIGNLNLFGEKFKLKPNWKDLLKDNSIKYADDMFQYYVEKLLMYFTQLNITEYPIVQNGALYGFSEKGFDGILHFKYSNGFTFSIETRAIWAGGYNIQAVHMRGLFKYYYNSKNLTSAQLLELYKNYKN